MPQVVVQHIWTLWTKRSRGGDAARLRNAVPTAVIIPKCETDAACILHQATYSESTEFSQHNALKLSDSFAELGLSFLSCQTDEDRLAIRFHRDGFNAATPSPYPHKDAFRLRPEEWGRVVYNGRYIDRSTGNWWYEQHVCNIGWFSQWTLSVFTRTVPDYEFQELVELW
jgi:hypothetical protein